jgi:hypothetical protein
MKCLIGTGAAQGRTCTPKCALSGLGETSKSTPYRLFALASLPPPYGENNTALRA